MLLYFCVTFHNPIAGCILIYLKYSILLYLLLIFQSIYFDLIQLLIQLVISSQSLFPSISSSSAYCRKLLITCFQFSSTMAFSPTSSLLSQYTTISIFTLASVSNNSSILFILGILTLSP